MRYGLLALLVLQAAAAEKAAYDSNGRILVLLDAAGDLEASSNIHAVLPRGKRIPIQMRRERKCSFSAPDTFSQSFGFAALFYSFLVPCPKA